jgi:hypothetical protein
VWWWGFGLRGRVRGRVEQAGCRGRDGTGRHEHGSTATDKPPPATGPPGTAAYLVTGARWGWGVLAVVGS